MPRLSTLLSILLLVCFGVPCSVLGQPSTPQVFEVRVESTSEVFIDKPVEIRLDHEDLPWPCTVEVAEIDASGAEIDTEVPFQLDRFQAQDATPHVELILLLKGETSPGRPRTYRVKVEEASIPRVSRGVGIGLEEGIDHEGQESCRIVTDTAAYYYHMQGAGLASLEDLDGQDWISYRPGGGSGGEYRGIPNMGHAEGYFHPGKLQSSSYVEARGPLRVRIRSESNDGTWAGFWDFFPGYARLTLIKTSHPYWFLYEGTPGGKLDLESDFCVRPGPRRLRRTPAAESWEADLMAPDQPGEWVYFGDGKKILYLVNHVDDSAVDSYWPMNGEMTVFGFGRKGLEKNMSDTPAQFTVGLVNDQSLCEINAVIRQSYAAPAVSIARVTERAVLDASGIE